ncbi:hypothetical protein EB796_022529 [Bugula neritina]|uniref:ABC transporter domain-containing protein n=1 Tax=Bugula neritina TaxID=10212 RepID=A0A7J7J0G3_BUGNE|nr:hypothetical protein EB796_022529 [Bugula neritina]
MFAEIEKEKESLGILGYGASVTTMEEVFMKVGEGSINSEEEGVDEMAIEAKTKEIVTKSTGLALQLQQFKAMLFKRMIYSWRNKALTLSQVLLPVFFAALTIIVLKIEYPKLPTPKRTLDIDMFDYSETFYNPGTAPAGLSTSFVNQFDKLQPDHKVVKVDDVEEALLDKAKSNLKEFNYNTILAAEFNQLNETIRVLHNIAGYHVAPVALLYADQALLHYFVNDSYSFSAANNPLPQTENAKSAIEAENAIASDFSDSFTISFNLLFGLAFLSTSFVVFLITERAQKVKHSQMVSGVKWYNFWLSTFTWDFINFMIPCLIVVIMFAIADIKNYTDIKDGNAQPAYIIGLLILHAAAILPTMYTLQFAFSGAATGYVVIVFYNQLTGIFPSLIVDILGAIEETKDIGKYLDWIFLVLFPNYNLSKGLAKLYNNYDFLDLCFNTKPKDVYGRDPGKDSLLEICDLLGKDQEDACCKDACGDSCINYQENYFAWADAGVGKYAVFLVIQCIFCWLIIVLIETEILVKLIYKIRPKVVVSSDESNLTLDRDVADEKKKILSETPEQAAQNNQVLISGLTKYFGDHKAVEDIYISIPKGECFGLLGVNGAGKTTTFRMLTGDESISGGTAYMNGKNIRTDIHSVQKTIGYCPQFDALIDQMTGEEMLYMYGRLRGIPEKSIGPIANELINSLLLTKHSKKLTKEYSGGNKRKLSTAIALIGDSPIIFLDEPTTGLDPVARRMLWKTLNRNRESGKTLILTSHSMEECEALCTRMAIMVNGKYRCLGSTQHLKSKFGAGYTLIARVSYPADGSLPDIQPIQDFVAQNFPDSTLKDFHQNSVQYDIPRENISWAAIFEKMESNKVSLNIEDYSVSQTTLEQVFLNFARTQVPPDESKPGCGRMMRRACCTLCMPEYVVESGHVTSTAL